MSPSPSAASPLTLSEAAFAPSSRKAASAFPSDVRTFANRYAGPKEFLGGRRVGGLGSGGAGVSSVRVRVPDLHTLLDLDAAVQ